MSSVLTSHRVVLVALDASPQSLAALEAAAAVAARLNAELRGMYVEDIDLVRTAELPFARVISLSGQPRPLTTEALQRQLNRHADMARSAVKAAGIRLNLAWSFSVVRGTVYRKIAEAATVAEFVTLGRSGWFSPPAKRLGSVVRSLADAGTTSLLMVGEDGLRKPFAVIYDGTSSSDRAVALASALNESGSPPVMVFAVGISGMERLRSEESQPPLKIASVDPEMLLDSILRSGAKTIAIPSTCFTRFRELVVLLDQGNLSVFIVK